MKEKELTELSDQELLEKRKKVKSTFITNAFFIGMMIGIIFYSIVENGLGIFILIPLFLAYKVTHNSKNDKVLDKALEKELKSRNLK